MKVLIHQSTPVRCDVAANLATVETSCRLASQFDADVAVFPELFLSGYNIGDEVRSLAEEIDGPLASALCRIARDNKINLVTGFAEREGGKLYNSAIAISVDGRIVGHHKKTFLFGDNEKETFCAGNGFPVFTLGKHTCGLAICYDIEFPEVTRDLKRRGAEVIFVPTANMDPYVEVPKSLVRARALENGVAIIYANLSGSEGMQSYTGLSAAVLPDGTDLARAGRDACIMICDLGPGLQRHLDRPLSNQLQDLEHHPLVSQSSFFL